jgi:hypothetical protein
VTQRWFGVRFRRNLAWGPLLAVHTCLQILVSLHASVHVGHVQPAPLGSAGREVRSPFFFNSAKRPQTFSTRWHHHGGHACQFSSISIARCISYDFPGRKTLKHCPDVTQRSFGVRFRRYLAWGPTLAVHTRVQILVSLHACVHVDHVQPAPFGSAGGEVRSPFFSTPPNGPNLFPHVRITMEGMHANSRRVPTLGAFPMIFPVEKP